MTDRKEELRKILKDMGLAFSDSEKIIDQAETVALNKTNYEDAKKKKDDSTSSSL